MCQGYTTDLKLYSPYKFGILVLLFSTGTLLPRLPSEPGMTLLTLKIEKIGLKDAGQCIEPYMTISVRGMTQIFPNLLFVYMKPHNSIELKNSRALASYDIHYVFPLLQTWMVLI